MRKMSRPGDFSNIPEEWFQTDTPLNQPTRYRHPGCSDTKDRALIISRNPIGWHVHCFRCGLSGFKSAKHLSPADMLKWTNSQRTVQIGPVEEVQLPDDMTYTIPTLGLAWLYGAGITNEEIEYYCIGYSRSLHRVILPVYEHGELIYFQGRYLGTVDKEHPKYMNVYQRDRKDTFFRVLSGVTGPMCHTVVLVEDILSAIRVGRQVDTIALLYAHVPDKLILKLAKNYKGVVLWLDPDKWGLMGRNVLRYRSLGLQVRIVLSDKDPKKYNDQQIEKYLKEVT